MEGAVVVPGDRVGHLSESQCGEGTFAHHQRVYASVCGRLRSRQQEGDQKRVRCSPLLSFLLTPSPLSRALTLSLSVCVCVSLSLSVSPPVSSLTLDP